MEIKIKYSREEVNKMVMEQHIKMFGSAPKGEIWICTGDYYDGWKIFNGKALETDKATKTEEEI